MGGHSTTPAPSSRCSPWKSASCRKSGIPVSGRKRTFTPPRVSTIAAVGGPLDPSGDVSVTITTYKTYDVVRACLRSFEDHRPRRVGEVIVVDNSADDETPRADDEFPWIRYVRNSENVHFRRAVNQGARIARHRYLLILNPDTYLTDSDSI